MTVTVLLLAVAALSSGGAARAQDAAPAQAFEISSSNEVSLGTQQGDLERWARDLASDDGTARRAACEALATLEPEALEAIRARVATFGRPVFDGEEAYRTINKFRHAVGSLRADEDVDVIPGLPTLLDEDRAPMTVALVERRLLARALVDMASIEAAPVLGDILATDAQAWRWEWRRMVWRLGPRALPVLLMLENHSDSGVRRHARWGMREVALTNPGRAVQTDDMRLLAEILRAYGTVREMDAMRVVVGYTVHERSQVREAARWATARFGRNAIWQLRRVYRNFTGERADGELGWEATAGALYAAYDAQRFSAPRRELAAAQAALGSGDLDAAHTHLDAVLVAAPDLPERGALAPGYAALGARALSAGDIPEATRFYRRALRLAPHDPSAPLWRAQTRYIEAEQKLAAGVADLGAYELVLADDPGHAGAQSFIAATRAAPGGESFPWKRVGLAAAALLLLGMAGSFWIRRRDDENDLALVENGEDDAFIDQNPDTLPG